MHLHHFIISDDKLIFHIILSILAKRYGAVAARSPVLKGASPKSRSEIGCGAIAVAGRVAPLELGENGCPALRLDMSTGPSPWLRIFAMSSAYLPIFSGIVAPYSTLEY